MVQGYRNTQPGLAVNCIQPAIFLIGEIVADGVGFIKVKE